MLETQKKNRKLSPERRATMARVFIRPPHTRGHGRKGLTELLSDTTRWHIPIEDSALALPSERFRGRRRPLTRTHCGRRERHACVAAISDLCQVGRTVPHNKRAPFRPHPMLFLGQIRHITRLFKPLPQTSDPQTAKQPGHLRKTTLLAKRRRIFALLF